MTLAVCLIVLAATGCRDSGLTSEEGPQVSQNVRVSPADASVEVGSSVKLTATFTAEDGSVDTTGFSWFTPDASIATVNQSGMITGVAPGQVAIAAITADRQFSAFADVTVLAPGEGGGEGGGSGGGGSGAATFPIINQSFGGANEPAGMTPVAYRDWESIGASCRSGKSWCAQGWTAKQTGNYRIANDPQRGQAAEAIHPQGHNGGSSGGFYNQMKVHDIVGANPAGYREVYVRYFMKLDPSYRPHGSGVLKVVTPQHGGSGSTFGSFWLRVFGIPPKPCTDPSTGSAIPCDPTWSQTSMEVNVITHPGWCTGGVQCTARKLNPNRGSSTIVRDRWYEVEFYMKGNSQGGDYYGNGDPRTTASTDGIVRVWLDGQLVLEYTDVVLHTGRLGRNLASHPLLTDGVQLWPGYGGNGGPGIPASQFIRFDNFYFSGR